MHPIFIYLLLSICLSLDLSAQTPILGLVNDINPDSASTGLAPSQKQTTLQDYPDVVINNGSYLNNVTMSFVFTSVTGDGCSTPVYRGFANGTNWYLTRWGPIRGYWLLYSELYGRYGYYINRNKTLLPPSSGWENKHQATDFLLFGEGSLSVSGGMDLNQNDFQINHYHQLLQKPLSSEKTSLNSNGNFKVCADGSTVSVFEIVGNDVQYWDLRIEGINANNSDLSGQLAVLSKDIDKITFSYTHPTYIPGSGQTNTVRLQVYQNSVPCLTTRNYEITVYRAPVLMVHGLWSGPESFSSMERALTTASLYPTTPNLINRIDYSATNNREFAFNVPQIPVAIDALLNSLRDDAHVAAGKVDYIAHSMGGTLGRLYLQHHKNYYDNIRRIITLNTPHSGSQLANLLVKPTDALSELTCYYILKALFNNTGCNDGALKDLQVDSPAIRDSLNGSLQLNYRTVPSHTIATVD